MVMWQYNEGTGNFAVRDMSVLINVHNCKEQNGDCGLIYARLMTAAKIVSVGCGRSSVGRHSELTCLQDCGSRCDADVRFRRLAEEDCRVGIRSRLVYETTEDEI
uniref:WSC domain-containing protein n=1 Tax=Ascaris lumbricoides TaxID=6252 RepID=A0A0M3HMY6_ASCLU